MLKPASRARWDLASFSAWTPWVFWQWECLGGSGLGASGDHIRGGDGCDNVNGDHETRSADGGCDGWTWNS